MSASCLAILLRTSASCTPVQVSSIPGMSTITTLCPPILASTTLTSLVQDWRPLPTFCFSDAMRLMNCFECHEFSRNEPNDTWS